jgi:hypothetical protein
MPSNLSLQACRNTTAPSSSVYSLNTMPAGARASSFASFTLRSLSGSGRSAVELQEVERVQHRVRGPAPAA